MAKTIRIIICNLVCFILVISLIGCSMQWDPIQSNEMDDMMLISGAGRIMEEQWSVVGSFLEDELRSGERSTVVGSDGNIDGQEVAQRILGEVSGREYLAFCNAISSTADAEELLSIASRLLPAGEYASLQSTCRGAEQSMRSFALEQARDLPPNQRPAFMRDLQKLVTKTLVLLVAGVVYACMPDVVFWGKVSAAAAIAVASGVVATTIMSLYRYCAYDQEGDLAANFEQWITDVTTEPAAAYAVAASMTTIGKTMANGPVVTGLVIAVFAIYQVIDMVKPMLKKYNFNA